MNALQLPVITDTEMAFANLAARCAQLHLPIAGIESELILECAKSPIKTFAQVSLTLGDFPLALLMEKSSFSNLCQEYQGIEKLPVDLQIACINHAFSDVFEKIEAFTHMPIFVQAINTTKSEPKTAYQVDIRIANNNSLIRLAMGEELALWCLENISVDAKVSVPSTDSKIPVDCLVGLTELSRSVFDDLEINDIIFLDQHFGIRDNKLLLNASNRYHYIVSCEDGKATVLTTMEKDMASSTRNPQAYDSHVKPSAESDNETKAATLSIVDNASDDEPSIEEVNNIFNDIPIALSFEVGSRLFTLDELSRIKNGYIFDLGVDVSAPVVVKTNGNAIATCELVEINQRVGARIIKTINTGE